MTTTTHFVDEESRWQAIVERNKSAQGYFYYAVKTTGIFCHPGCASRLPKRDNVEFFTTHEAAIAAGYRPCQRCHPCAPLPAADLITPMITQACRHLEQAEPPPKLAELAAEAGLSPWHFQRLFKKTLGVTPKQYAAALQAHRFRENLAAGHSVTEAIYQAGFSSSSRAYENARQHLAVKPSVHKQGAAGLIIHYSIAACFLGWLIVAATEQGICAIALGDAPETLPAQIQQQFPKATLQADDARLSVWVRQIMVFLSTPAQGLNLPLDIQGTAFQKRVWQALRDIPFGMTVSYTDIAEQIGEPNAVRAVASACAANKLAVAIPCHRVVRRDGELSGYRWGIDRKRELLKWEDAQKSHLCKEESAENS